MGKYSPDDIPDIMASGTDVAVEEPRRREG